MVNEEFSLSLLGTDPLDGSIVSSTRPICVCVCVCKYIHIVYIMYIHTHAGHSRGEKRAHCIYTTLASDVEHRRDRHCLVLNGRRQLLPLSRIEP